MKLTFRSIVLPHQPSKKSSLIKSSQPSPINYGCGVSEEKASLPLVSDIQEQDIADSDPLRLGQEEKFEASAEKDDHQEVNGNFDEEFNYFEDIVEIGDFKIEEGGDLVFKNLSEKETTLEVKN